MKHPFFHISIVCYFGVSGWMWSFDLCCNCVFSLLSVAWFYPARWKKWVPFLFTNDHIKLSVLNYFGTRWIWSENWEPDGSYSTCETRLPSGNVWISCSIDVYLIGIAWYFAFAAVVIHKYTTHAQHTTDCFLKHFCCRFGFI